VGDLIAYQRRDARQSERVGSPDQLSRSGYLPSGDAVSIKSVERQGKPTAMWLPWVQS
jgi:hypothetical protein